MQNCKLMCLYFNMSMIQLYAASSCKWRHCLIKNALVEPNLLCTCRTVEQSAELFQLLFTCTSCSIKSEFNVSILECWFLRVTWFKQYTQINLSTTPISSCSGDNDVQDFFQIKPFTEREQENFDRFSSSFLSPRSSSRNGWVICLFKG